MGKLHIQLKMCPILHWQKAYNPFYEFTCSFYFNLFIQGCCKFIQDLTFDNIKKSTKSLMFNGFILW